MDINRYRRCVCSQWGEDGITEYLIDQVGKSTRYAVEIGFGWECNIGNLLSNHGWTGLLIDANEREVRRGQERWPTSRCVKAYVTRTNVDQLVAENMAAEPDVLSIDIDGMDYHIWRALTCIEPRVVIIEYNASLGPYDSVSVPYIEPFNRMDYNGLYHGASLEAMRRLGERKGYGLVGCEAHGVNAFFVRKDLLRPPLESLPTEEAYRDHGGRWPWGESMQHLVKLGFKLENVEQVGED